MLVYTFLTVSPPMTDDMVSTAQTTATHVTTINTLSSTSAATPLSTSAVSPTKNPTPGNINTYIIYGYMLLLCLMQVMNLIAYRVVLLQE